jgi:hypothetical protein
MPFYATPIAAKVFALGGSHLFQHRRMLWLQPTVLPWDVASHIAELAKVTDDLKHFCCVGICAAVQRVWEWDRRSVSSEKSEALIEAAKAAQALKAAVKAMNETDRKWVQQVADQHTILDDIPLRDDLDRTLSVLSHLFNTAIGRPDSDDVAAPRKRGRKKGDSYNRAFQIFVSCLLFEIHISEGKLTFDKNSEKGTLIDALNILRPHLPRGVIPNVLPLGTIQTIKTRYPKEWGL